MTTHVFWRRGITLVEMLVAMAITLVMMAAVVTLFDQMGRGVNDSRATIEMAARLRGAQQVLHSDLGNLTCQTLPWNHPESGAGYFEYVEGPRSDLDPTDPILIQLQPGISLVPTNPAGTYSPPHGLGDYDDILMFTVHSRSQPFVGRFGAETIESPMAEVVWYAVANPADGSLGEPGMRTIYRRVLLLAPWTATTLASAPPVEDLYFFLEYDVSSHVEDRGGPLVRVPNSLSDLAKRENRFAHRYFDQGKPNLEETFPHAVFNAVSDGESPRGIDQPRIALRPFSKVFSGSDARQGEDVVLTNVLAFDVLAYDPAAPVYTANGVTVGPGDPGWQDQQQRPGAQAASFGAYVNLGYFPRPGSNPPCPYFRRVIRIWCPWTRSAR